VYVTATLRNKELGSKDVHFLDVAATVHDAAKQECAATLLQDAVDGNWHDIAEKSGVYFPLEVARVGTQVDIAKATASVAEDHNAILNYVAVKQSLRTEAPTEHAQYDRLNSFVHAIFASAELYRLACERPEGSVEAMERLLKLQADPNKFVRRGNTALFAVIGADPLVKKPAASKDLLPMLELLIKSKADPNCANSQLATVLDCAGDLAEPAQALLRAHGAKSFDEVSPVLEQKVNKALEEIVSKGFASEKSSFGGSGGGGDGAKLMRIAEQCLEKAAVTLNIYPTASCHIQTLLTKQDKFRRRGGAVESALKSAGCRNTIDLQSVNNGPLVRLTISFPMAKAKVKAEAKPQNIDVREKIGLSTSKGETQEEIEGKVRECFEKADKNHNKVLSKYEFKRIFTELPHCDLSATQIEALFKHIDTNNNGVLSFDEFFKYMYRYW